MKVIVCVDKSNGMMFNNRRQSQDSVLREKVISLLDGKKLFLNESLFPKSIFFNSLWGTSKTINPAETSL